MGYLEPSCTETLGYHIPANPPKEARGLHSHITARFLIPRHCLEAFEANPDRYIWASSPFTNAHTAPFSIIAKFNDDEDHEYSLIAEEWPTFLYDEQAGWSKKDLRRGLFRGHVLVRVSSESLQSP